MYYVLEEARQKLTSIASHLLRCPAEEVVLQDRQAFDRRDPTQAIPFPQVAAAAYDEEMLPPSVEPGLDFKGTHSLPASPYAFGAHVAVVQVSRESGHITILNYAAVHDAGPHHQPDARGRTGARRHRPGNRSGPDGRHDLQRRRTATDRQSYGLRPSQSLNHARLYPRYHRNTVSRDPPRV